MAKRGALDSIRKRYFITLLSNGVLFVASFVTAGIVPRALGPKQLGDFGFLNRVSSAFRNMLDMGTSSAFFNYSAKHSESGGLTRIYSVWMFIQLGAILGIISLACLVGLSDLIWPGQQFNIIIWVALLDWVVFTAALLKQLGDSKGFTLRAQVINLALSLFNILLLVLLALKGCLNLRVFITVQILTSIVISLAIIVGVVFPNKDVFWVVSGAGKKLTDYAKYFYKFCSPLVVISVFSFIFEYYDRMVLQKFSGSIQQGYFHIASSWAAFSTIFTASMLSIYKREIARHLGRHDLSAASQIFSKYLKMLYFITLVLAVFLAFHARELLGLIAGPKFSSAAAVMIIMAFYPIHQVYGQLGGAAFYSTEKTYVLRNISVVAMLAGIPLTYFFLAPKSGIIPGLGLGSAGLALKTVVWNLLLVQVYLVFNCRYFKLKAAAFWWHQFYSFAIVLAAMFLVRVLGGALFRAQSNSVLVAKLCAETVFYFLLAGFLAYFFPFIAGLTREEVSFFLTRVRQAIVPAKAVG